MGVTVDGRLLRLDNDLSRELCTLHSAKQLYDYKPKNQSMFTRTLNIRYLILSVSPFLVTSPNLQKHPFVNGKEGLGIQKKLSHLQASFVFLHFNIPTMAP